MLIKTIIHHKEWSDRIRRRGIGATARKAMVDKGYLSRLVNEKAVVSEKMLERLVAATNELPIKKLKGGKVNA